MNILFLSRWFPFPSDNGSRQRIAALLSALTERHRVTLLSFVEHEGAHAYAEADHAHLDAVYTVSFPRVGTLRPYDALFAAGPRSLVRQHSWLMTEQLSELVMRGEFDVLVGSEIDMLPYAAAAPVALRISEDVEIGVHYDALLRGGLRARLRWMRLTRYLRHALKDFALCTTVSERERRLIDEFVAPACATSVTPNGVDVAACARVRAEPQPDTLIYAGALSYAANFDAVSYFIAAILPRIRAERPGVKLRVTGAVQPEVLARLPRDPSVEFTGYLDDVRPTIAASWASVVPLRVGSGTRLKILESMALGVPVVTTSKGAEGLHLQHGGALMIADEPDAFAQHVLDVLRDAALRDALAARSRRIVAERYDWAAIGAQFVARVEAAAEKR